MIVARLTALSLALALAAAPACRRNPAPDAEPVTGPPVVTVAVARVETLKSIVSGSGTIVPAASSDWTIYAPETGRIASMPKVEGDEVKAGDLLVRFEFGTATQDLSARETDVAAAGTRLDAAKATLARITPMFDRGYASRNDFDAARRAVDLAESDLNRAKQQLEMTTEAADRGVVKARFAGVVTKRFHAEGDFVNASPGDPVMRVTDPTHIQVAMPVPLVQFILVQSGQQATIMSIANPAGDPATVIAKIANADPLATIGDVRLGFVTPPAMPLDTPVQVEILVDQRENALSIPVAAVQKGDAAARYVMIAGADGRAHRRDVQLGLTARDRIEIVSGLTAGDRVIVKGLEAVTDGAEITVER